MNKHIVLLHGLWESKSLMGPISKRFNKEGYISHTIDYSTVNINFNDLFSQLDKVVLEAYDEPVYFLGHSLGGVMLRTYFDLCGPVENSKLVTMGSPHQPSHAAEFIKKIGLSKMFGNAMELGLIEKHCNDEWVHDMPMGNIAGDLPIGLIQLIPQNFLKGITRSHDGMVLVDETHVKGQTDHVVVNCSHIAMPYAKETFRQASNFLREGEFEKEEKKTKIENKKGP